MLACEGPPQVLETNAMSQEKPGFLRRRYDVGVALFDQFPLWMMLVLIVGCFVWVGVAFNQAGPFGTWGFWTWFDILFPVFWFAMLFPATISKWKDR
jgi:hypothetical protein